jgi:hypothetical protein
MAYHDFRYDDHDLDRTTNYNYAGRPAKPVKHDPLTAWQAIAIAVAGVATIWSWWFI